MVHKAIAQTIIMSMQNLSLAELTINFSNTTGMSIAPRATTNMVHSIMIKRLDKN